MEYQRNHKSLSRSPQSPANSHQFGRRTLVVNEHQVSHQPSSREGMEIEAFQQNKFEAFGLQLKEKRGNITPVEQEKLGLLQADMDDYWARRMERSKTQPNLLEYLMRSSQATQTNESQAPVQSNTILARSETTGDRPNWLAEQQPNQTGLPDNVKAGIEHLSGYSLSDVRVHRNSPRPAQLQALAYTQNTEIHVAPGEEEHIPHEAWHVVQQAQGRVMPTMKIANGVSVDDNVELEKEADVMGAKALALAAPGVDTSQSTVDVKEGPNALEKHAVQRKLMPRISIAKDLAHYPYVREALFTEATLEAFPGPRQLVGGEFESQVEYVNELMRKALEEDPNISYKKIQEAKHFSADSWNLVKHIRDVARGQELMFLLKGSTIGVANKVDNTYVHPRIFGGMPDVDMAGTITTENLGYIRVGHRNIDDMSLKEKRKALMGWQGKITFTNSSGHFKFDTIPDDVQRTLTEQVKEGLVPHQKELVEDVQVAFQKVN